MHFIKDRSNVISLSNVVEAYHLIYVLFPFIPTVICLYLIYKNKGTFSLIIIHLYEFEIILLLFTGILEQKEKEESIMEACEPNHEEELIHKGSLVLNWAFF